LPPEISELIQNKIFDKSVAEISQKYLLSDKTATQLSNEVFLTILFFESLSTLEKRIGIVLEIEIGKAKQIYLELYESLFKFEAELFAEFKTETLEPEQSFESNAQDEATLPADSSEISELEKTINSLPKMRTMSADMQASQDKDTTQSISQEDLLNRKS
jgi:hypothetical protein